MTIQIPISKRVRRHNGSEQWDKSQLFLKGEPEGIVTFLYCWGNLKFACEDWISCRYKFPTFERHRYNQVFLILREADACWVFQILHLLAGKVGKGIARFRVCCKPTGAEFFLENFSDLQKYFAESCQRNETGKSMHWWYHFFLKFDPYLGK